MNEEMKDMLQTGAEALAENAEVIGEAVVEPAKKLGKEIAKNVGLFLGGFGLGYGAKTLWDDHQEYKGLSKEEKKELKAAKKAARKAIAEQRKAELTNKFKKDKNPEIVDSEIVYEETTEE